MFLYPFGFMIFSFVLNLSIWTHTVPSLTFTPSLYKGSLVILENDGSSGPIVAGYESLIPGGYLLKINQSAQDYTLSDHPNAVVAASITQTNLTAFFDNEAYHSAPLALNLLFNAILKSVCEMCSIEVTNEPFAASQEMISTGKDPAEASIAFALSTGMIYAIFVPLFILFYVKERVCRSKLLQVVSGIDIFVYWLASFLWDLVLFIIFTVIFLVGVVINQKELPTSFALQAQLFLILLVFAFAALPMIYMAAFIFRVPSTGVTSLLFFFFLIGKYFLKLKLSKTKLFLHTHQFNP